MKNKSSFKDKLNKLNILEQRRIKQEQKQKEEKELIAKNEKIENNLSKTTNIHEQSLNVQKGTNEVGKKMVETYIEVEENKKIILEREGKLREDEQILDEDKREFAEREAKLLTRESTFNHKYEIMRQREERAMEKDRELDKERKNIKEREQKADDRIKASEQKAEEYREKLKQLEYREKSLNTFKENLDKCEQACREKEIETDRLYNENKSAHDILRTRIAEFEREYETKIAEQEKIHEETEQELRSKIDELDRKLEDVGAFKDTIDSVKFDKSPEGRQAKIVVKEAIRAAIESTKEQVQKLEEIDNLYNKGTFSGFAIPLFDIDKVLKQVKVNFEAIKVHNEKSDNTFGSWIEEIEKYIESGNNSRKKHLFGDTYRNYLFAQAFCNGYIAMVNIFNEYNNSSDTTSGDDDSEYYSSSATGDDTYSETSELKDYYDILDVDFDCCTKDIKKIFRQLSKKYHPDHNDGIDSDGMFEKIKEAYEVLSDKAKRESYDRKYQAKKQAS